jgi:hypothetical protein
MTVYVQAHVNSNTGLAGTFQIVELVDEEGDDLTRHLDQASKLFTIGELKEALRSKFNTDVCIEVIADGPLDIPLRIQDSR